MLETWLSNYIFNNEILPTGYTIYRRDRLSRGGGVLIAVRNSISLWLVSTPADLEVVTIGVQLQHLVILSCVYVPPSASLTNMEQLCLYLSSLVVQHSAMVVVGDFNLPHINWSTLQGSCPFDQAFCDIVFDCNLSQLVSQPTHIAGNTLDLVLNTESAVIEALRVQPAADCPLSMDHFMLSFGLQGEAFLLQRSSCASSTVVFDYSKADWEGLCNYIS